MAEEPMGTRRAFFETAGRHVRGCMGAVYEKEIITYVIYSCLFPCQKCSARLLT